MPRRKHSEEKAFPPVFLLWTMDEGGAWLENTGGEASPILRPGLREGIEDDKSYLSTSGGPAPRPKHGHDRTVLDSCNRGSGGEGEKTREMMTEEEDSTRNSSPLSW